MHSGQIKGPQFAVFGFITSGQTCARLWQAPRGQFHHITVVTSRFFTDTDRCMVIDSLKTITDKDSTSKKGFVFQRTALKSCQMQKTQIKRKVESIPKSLKRSESMVCER